MDWCSPYDNKKLRSWYSEPKTRPGFEIYFFSHQAVTMDRGALHRLQMATRVRSRVEGFGSRTGQIPQCSIYPQRAAYQTSKARGRRLRAGRCCAGIKEAQLKRHTCDLCYRPTESDRPLAVFVGLTLHHDCYESIKDGSAFHGTPMDQVSRRELRMAEKTRAAQAVQD